MILKRPGAAVGLAAVMLAATYFLTLAGKAGMVNNDVGTRAVMAMTGLIVAMLGNSVPKTLKQPRSSAELEQRIQAGLRQVGWTMMLGGLAFSLAWVIAPGAIVWPLSLAVMGIVFVIALVEILRCRFGAAQPS